MDNLFSKLKVHWLGVSEEIALYCRSSVIRGPKITGYLWERQQKKKNQNRSERPFYIPRSGWRWGVSPAATGGRHLQPTFNIILSCKQPGESPLCSSDWWDVNVCSKNRQTLINSKKNNKQSGKRRVSSLPLDQQPVHSCYLQIINRVRVRWHIPSSFFCVSFLSSARVETLQSLLFSFQLVRVTRRRRRPGRGDRTTPWRRGWGAGWRGRSRWGTSSARTSLNEREGGVWGRGGRRQRDVFRWRSPRISPVRPAKLGQEALSIRLKAERKYIMLEVSRNARH